MKVLLPTSTTLEPAAIDGVEWVEYRPSQPVPEEHRDAEVVVTWGNPRPQLAEMTQTLPQLRLVQTLTAGTDTVEEAGFAEGVRITSGVGLHDVTVTEHALALLLAVARQIPASVRAQDRSTWRGDLLTWQTKPESGLTTLRGARILVWGFGSIGQTLAPHLTALGAEVVGAAQSAGERGGYRVVGPEGLDAELAAADAVVMILPGSPATRHAMNAEKLALLKKTAWVVNVGRGSGVDQEALLTAIREDRIAGAALDVTDPEPLPEESPLWGEPRILITPHIAGGRPIGAVALIEKNVRALAAGEALTNEVRR